MKFLLSLLSLLIFISCQESKQKIDAKDLEQVLNDNPDIVLNWMKKNDEKFMSTLQSLAIKRQRSQQANQQKSQEQALANQINNPLKYKLDASRVLGKVDAPIVIIEYSDFECPYCKRGFDVVQQLKKQYKDRLVFSYRHLPLAFHKQAMPTALAFEAILQQDKQKAYKFHDILFSRQKELSSKGTKLIDEIAKSLKVDLSRMKKDMESDKIKKVIEKHIQEARSYGISGTPGFLVNGVSVKGAYPKSHFDQIINKTTKK